MGNDEHDCGIDGVSQLDELRAEVVRLDAERDEARRQAEKAWGKIRENQELRDSADMEEAARTASRRQT